MTNERPGQSMGATTDGPVVTHDHASASLVVCSLEPWTDVRRRLRILVDEMIDDDPQLRVLYVAPSVDPLHLLRTSPGALARLGSAPRLEDVHPRVRVLRPRKWAPRRLGAFVQRSLDRQVRRAAADFGLERPVLWVNDAAYAGLLAQTGWPSVYDVTDDWLLADLPERQRARLEAHETTLLQWAGAVVVCSPDLARTRGATRPVDLIPNAVDVERFRRPQPRPAALPSGPVAVYVGTLQDDRFDTELTVQLARERPDIQFVLVGPDCLSPAASNELRGLANIRLTGPVPYEEVPGYLQHADVIVVPHRVNAFTESLDPIKAYESLAAGRPTVATPVAGFRELGPPVRAAEPPAFGAALDAALADGSGGPPPSGAAAALPTWHDRALAAAAVIDRVRRADRGADGAPT
jgi:glycosyltransferase involved in cell wall biosynthesis